LHYEPEGIYTFVLRKRQVPDPDPVTYMGDLCKSLRKCDKEDLSDDDDQPLHIDEASEGIKCKWYPT